MLSISALPRSYIDPYALIAAEGFFTERLRSLGVRVLCPQWDFAAPIVSNAVFASRVLQDIRPDIVHCNAVVGMPFLTAVRLAGLPIVQHVRVADLIGYEDHLLCADRIATVSRFIADEVSKAHVNPHKIRTLHDGVDCERFCPNPEGIRDIRSELSYSQGDFVVLCIARFAQNKRHDVLIEAVARTARSYPATRLIMIGDSFGDDTTIYERCCSQVDAAGLAKATTILGFQEDVRSFERAADVVVLGSEREPLGTAVLESMALGRAIIVSNSGGLPEMIEDGVSGLLCEPGNPESLYEKLLFLAQNPSLRAELGRKARERALSRFSRETHARCLMEIYDELTSSYERLGISTCSAE